MLTCSACAFWHRLNVDRTNSPGECRRHPPKIITPIDWSDFGGETAAVLGATRFPITLRLNGCGDAAPVAPLN